MNVDESRRDDHALHVDDTRCGGRDGRSNPNDRVTSHGQVGAIPRAARAVDDASAAEDEIVVGWLGAEDGRHQQHEQEQLAHAGTIAQDRSIGSMRATVALRLRS